MDVVVWLRSLGLGKYAAAFRENEITEKVLNLTAEDLKELGISIVGHRRVERVESLEAERENASPEVPSSTPMRGCCTSRLSSRLLKSDSSVR
jgi:hypothetical protein